MIDAMELDDLFIDTVEDLRTRSRLRMTDYDATQASGLIRRLLVDRDTPLLAEVLAVDRGGKDLSLVNPTFRWMTNSEVVGIGPDMRVFGLVASLHLDPKMFAGPRSRAQVTKRLSAQGITLRGIAGTADEFLSAVVVRPDADTGFADVTIRQLIKHFANREGGVHYGAGGWSTSDTVEHLRDHPTAALALRQTVVACGRIVSRALEPIAIQLAFRNQVPR